MSKIGKLPIQIPGDVKVGLDEAIVKITGPKGTLTKRIPKGISLRQDGGTLMVENKKNTSDSSAIHGTTRAILANMVKGVTVGWSKTLELVGTGFRAEVSGNILSLTVGYSHPVKIEAPNGVSFRVEKTDITVEGPDREIVGSIAAKIRGVRPPEPYKGKGIKYKDEVIRRKAGKAAKAVGAA